ncbi:protein kinase domain-containing protein [Catenuloplanes japonicus]|uniref:protein kinase domain-containing protein n=1 Tax=Catenuloplanes japonicus TaxID=33876 RepID=UPI0006906554
MGRVWLARDEMLRRDVAVKELVPPPGLSEAETAQLRERSLREARAIAQLNHSNAVRIFDVLIDGGDPWIVMEFIPSQPLHSVLRAEGPLSPAAAARIGLAVLGALSAAHRVGVLHRDVKPANVLLGTDGRIMLTDFGLATVEDDPTMTRTGIVLGSPAYLAPERAIGEPAGPASDLWSLGATLYAAVEGRSPYARSSSIATLAALATELPAPPQRAGTLFPVLEGLLRKDPARRINAAEAEKLLQQAAGSGEEASAPVPQTAAPLPPAVPRPRRNERAEATSAAASGSPPDSGGGTLDARYGYRGAEASASVPIAKQKSSPIPGVEGSFGYSGSGVPGTPTARRPSSPSRTASELVDQFLGTSTRPVRLAVMILVPLLVLLVVLLLVIPMLGDDDSGRAQDPAAAAGGRTDRDGSGVIDGTPSAPPTANGAGAGLPRPGATPTAPSAGETSATRPATSVTGTPAPTPAFAGRPIVSYGSGQCIDVPDSDASTQRPIQMWECNGKPGQSFELTSDGQLRALGRCLEVTGGGDGATMRLAACDGAWDQVFSLNSEGDLVNTRVDRCVDVMDSNTGNGALIQIWECNGGSHQKWYVG